MNFGAGTSLSVTKNVYSTTPQRVLPTLATGVSMSERFNMMTKHRPLVSTATGIGNAHFTAGKVDIMRSSNSGLMGVLPSVQQKSSMQNKLLIMALAKKAELLQQRRALAALRPKKELNLKSYIGVGSSKRQGQNLVNSVPRVSGFKHNVAVRRRIAQNNKGQLRLPPLQRIGKTKVGQFNQGTKIRIGGNNKTQRLNNGVNNTGKKGKFGLNFFGSPKSKAALDKEIDSYMAKVRNKPKSATDLDKELEAYMLVAKSKATAALKATTEEESNTEIKTDADNNTKTKATVIDDDVDMEEV